MDILYMLGQGSRHNNQELRWSLRSLEKYGKNVGNISVVGNPPDWLSPDVKTLRTEHNFKLVQKNMWWNVEAAVREGLVKDTFLLLCDDYFYVKEIDFDKHPVFVIGEIPTVVDPDEKHYEYKLGLVGSRWMLGKNGMPTRMTSNHNALLVDTESFRRYPWMVRQCRSAETRMNVFCILGNMYIYDHPDAEIETRRDIKIFDAISAEKLDETLKYADLLSIDDGAFDGEAFVDFMNSEFSQKSRWEA